MKIYVQPTDEAAPSWSGSSSLSKSENLAVGTTLDTFTVTDSDTGGHGILKESIALVDNFGGTFQLYVEDNAGSTSYDVQLILAKPLDYERVTSYSLTLTASDPDTTDTHAVALTVTNEAEFPPSCSETAILIAIKETVNPTTVLHQALNCNPKDVGETITYTSTDANGRFTISSTTGEISLTCE